MNLEPSPLSWSDHLLLGFGLCTTEPLCEENWPITMVHPKRLMDLTDFQNVLEVFLTDMVDSPVDVLVTHWYSEVTQTVDTIALKHPLLCGL